MDTGYRIILAADVISISGYDSLQEDIDLIIKKSGGRSVNKPGNRKIVVYMNGAQAVECAATIIRHVQNLPDKPTEVRIGISAGEPVTAKADVFADAIELANRLCDIAGNQQIFISSLAKQITGEIKLRNDSGEKTLKILDPEDEQFVNLLIETSTALLSGPSLNIDSLSKHLGMSRSRLYRRITNLTGCSANSFIQELRMQKALRLIRNKYGNVTQVAMEVGFNNPSYFAKSFQKRFGILPFKAAKLNS